MNSEARDATKLFMEELCKELGLELRGPGRPKGPDPDPEEEYERGQHSPAKKVDRLIEKFGLPDLRNDDD